MYTEGLQDQVLHDISKMLVFTSTNIYLVSDSFIYMMNYFVKNLIMIINVYYKILHCLLK